jgi:hypothetical protein
MSEAESMVMSVSELTRGIRLLLEENFGQMRRTLGRRYECVQLYKSYLENFRINTQDALSQ